MTAPKWSCDIALTVTLKGSQKRLDAEGQYTLTKDKVLNRLRNCHHTTIVELTTNFDVHYHSILKLDLNKANNKSALRYIKDVFRADFGYTCVKQVEDYDGWAEYLAKDITATSAVLSPIVKDDYGIFDKFHVTLD